ncbi:MAG: ribosome biogenesis GTPase Der [Deltaproteobacteria bacterium]|nr:ribosome biogenesis GTPase Der [Deltaproteobacteria bacterium]
MGFSYHLSPITHSLYFSMKPIVAIIGRPNVGKSTLFNRLIGKKKAIVKEEPGVTRDLNYGDVEEGRVVFTLVDTGGFVPEVGPEDEIRARVKELAHLAIEEADIIIFLMDGREGLTPSDRGVAEILRKVDKPVIYAVNKMDTPKQDIYLSEFYNLGVEPIVPISAEHGRGVYELLERVVAIIPKVSPVEVKEERVKIAVVGRPNVGKSTLVNKLLGYERVIVSSVPGTTRDAIDTPF